MRRFLGLSAASAASVLLLLQCDRSVGIEPRHIEDGDSGVGGSTNTGGHGFSGDFSVSGQGGCVGTGCGDGAGGTGGAEAFCGDGLVNAEGENCDDRNNEAGDGCSATCVREANFACPTPGQPCVSTMVCGDKLVTGTEQCDDGNTQPGDGCSAACQIEPGWACPFVGLRCVAAECGDGIVAGFEECDDGDADDNDGCSSTCKVEDGFKCDAPGVPCTPIVCGDGVKEGTEQCDDANYDLGDGCTPYCKLEPDCSQGACVSSCGDGIRLGNEECDDGNQRNGDGCSSDCIVELGFRCEQPPLPERLEIPIVIRDFAGLDPMPSTSGNPADYTQPNHVDFELVGDEPGGDENGANGTMRIVRSGQAATSTGRGRDLGAPGETFTIKHLNGTAIGTVSLAGKPVYFNTSCDRTALPAGNSWLKCTKTTMDADSFHTWYVDRDVSGNAVTWPNFLGRGQTYLKKLTLLRGSFTGTPPSNNFTAGGASYVFDSRFMRIDGTRPTPPNNADGIGFFPIDGTGLNSGTACNDNQQHNFHFTSEVRFWFQYDSSKEPRLDFSGDDDVWVYVNGHLALDLGGIHGRLASSFTINATNATAWGLENGKVYEIAVFQAERNICLSNYWLTLNGFNAAKDVCSSICGDGILASDELCDDGEANHPTNPPPYGICGPDCKTRGPFCGDGARQQPQEECDDGLNLSTYDFDGTGCAPGCIRPAHCGDGQIDAPYEECDKGAGNDGSYGGCTSTCRLAARCGDGIVQREFGEQCDDGPRGSASCSPSCLSTVPR